MKLKYIDGQDWDWLNDYDCDIRKCYSPYKGLVAVISNTTVKYQLTFIMKSHQRFYLMKGINA